MKLISCVATIGSPSASSAEMDSSRVDLSQQTLDPLGYETNLFVDSAGSQATLPFSQWFNESIEEQHDGTRRTSPEHRYLYKSKLFASLFILLQLYLLVTLILIIVLENPHAFGRDDTLGGTPSILTPLINMLFSDPGKQGMEEILFKPLDIKPFELFLVYSDDITMFFIFIFLCTTAAFFTIVFLLINLLLPFSKLGK